VNRRRLLLAALLGAPLAACSSRDELHGLNGTDISGSGIGRDFSLMGADGRRHRLADYRGKAVMVFFGFTQCPDVCPTAMARAVEIRGKLGADAARLQVIFITVDPERDTPEVLQAYVRAFDPAFLGLYGTAGETRQTAQAFRVYYQKVPTGSSYTMDHTALSYVYDTQGRPRVALKHTQSAEDCAADIRKVLALDGAARR